MTKVNFLVNWDFSLEGRRKEKTAKTETTKKFSLFLVAPQQRRKNQRRAKTEGIEDTG